MNFCSHCGGRLSHRVPPGDERPRDICDCCGTVYYQNPKMVVGTLPRKGDRILLCRRAIAPRIGMWTLPAGFLEMGETVEEGARRETREEAGAEVVNLVPFALFNLAFVSQVYFLFLADLASGVFAPGAESQEVCLFREDDIPWPAIAFPVIRDTLRRFFEDRRKGRFGFHMGDVGREDWEVSGAPPDGIRSRTGLR